MTQTIILQCKNGEAKPYLAEGMCIMFTTLDTFLFACLAFFVVFFFSGRLCSAAEASCHKWLLELRGVSARSLNSGPPCSEHGGAAEAASASRLGRFSAGLDVGSAGLFWLRGVGLCKHAKLAASSKRIGESGESS